MPKRFLWIAALLLPALNACVSYTVKKEKPRRGPVAAVGYIDYGRGEVKYSPEGWGWFIRARRWSAMRRMRRICRGVSAHIVEEFENDDIEVAYSSDDLEANVNKGLDHYRVAPFYHVVFECGPKEGTRDFERAAQRDAKRKEKERAKANKPKGKNEIRP